MKEKSLVRNLKCENCGKEFVSVIKRDNGYVARFCSKQCAQPKVKKICTKCGKQYEVIPFRKDKSKYCSKQCMLDVSNPTDGHVYNRKDWHEARQAALERDEYTCQVCGKQNKEANLHVNHILPYRIIQSHHPMNLVTLCSSCHAHMDFLVRDLLHVHPARKRFLEILGEMWLTNIKKSNNYAQSNDPLSNLKSSEQIGIPGSIGNFIRMHDKWSRLTQLMNGKKDEVGESIKDTLLDLANYCCLEIILLEEQEKHKPPLTKAL